VNSTSPNPKLSWKEKLKLFVHTINKAEVRSSSVIVTYYLLFAFFPMLIMVGNVLPYLQISEQTVLIYIKEMLPLDIYDKMQGTIVSLLTQSNSGLLSVSAIGTFWAVSRSISAIQMTLDKIYGVARQKNFLITRLLSVIWVILFLLIVVLLVVIIGFGQTVVDYLLPILQLPMEISDTFSTLKWPVTAIVLFVILLLIYYFVPNTLVPFRTVVPGAVFTTISWMVVTQFFGLYIHYFSQSITSYGIIGSVIVFIIWLNIASTLIIVGGVINVVTAQLLYVRIRPRDLGVSKYVRSKLEDRKEKNTDR